MTGEPANFSTEAVGSIDFLLYYLYYRLLN